MKLLPKAPKDVRASHDDSLGHGMDAVLVLAVFLLVGWGLDQAFDTLPVFMIVMTVLGAVGLFARFYYAYAGRMEQHEAARASAIAQRTAARRAGATDAPHLPPVGPDLGAADAGRRRSREA